MPLTSRGRRRKALAQPFPNEWRVLLHQSMAHWSMLSDAERARLEELIRILLIDKNWEATRGFQLTAEIRVLISAMASILILGLDYDYYHRVTSIIVGPTAMVFQGEQALGGGIVSDEPQLIIGQARQNGPVLIAWDAARGEARHPERGHNVVYHEFAHQLDMLEGSVDGTPPLDTSGDYAHWAEVVQTEYRLLRDGYGGDLLDPYGAVSPAEFFAVATELFFDRPTEMEAQKRALYATLRDFYRQDPATRERR